MTNPACIATIQEKEWMSKDAWLERHQQHLAIRDTGGFDLVLLGDSITQGWNGAGQEVFARDFSGLSVANFGIAGDACEHLLWRIENGVLDGLTPRVINLLIGTNNLGNEGHSGAQTAEGITTVLTAVRERCPNAIIILNAVFPRDEEANTTFRQEITIINDSIRSLADGISVVLLDIGQRFLADADRISKVVMPDYLHLSTLGYIIWSEELQPLLRQHIPQN